MENSPDFYPVRGCKAEITLKMTVMVIKDGDEYTCFVKPEGGCYREMFGLPVKQQGLKEACDIAVANAPKDAVMIAEEEA